MTAEMRLLAVAAISAMLLVLMISQVDAATGDLSPRGEHAFAEIAACAASSDHLLAAIVVDSSSSLQRTDPGNERVGAIETVIDSLESLQRTSDGRVTIEASLATFSGSYAEMVPWGVVADRHADALLSAARSDLPSRNTGDFTDYRAALSGAQQALSARAAEVGAGSCSVLLWFTDGQLDVPGTGEAEAWSQMCRPQGQVDGVRRAGTSIVAVALAAQGNAQAAVWREELRAIAEGAGSGTRCGTTPLPAGARPGAFLRADDPGALRRLFAGVGSLIQGGAAAASVVCPGPECDGGVLSVPLDAGVSGFRAVIDAAPGARAWLVGPNGNRIAIASGSAQAAGADVDVSSRDGLAVVAVSYPAGSPASRVWTLETGGTSASPALVDLYYVWGVSASVTAPGGLIVGQSSPVEIALSFPDGSPVPAGVYESVQVTLLADGAEIPVATEDGIAVGDVTVPEGDAVSSVAFSALVRATTVPNAHPLAEARAATRIPTALPAAFPSLTTSSLTLPPLVGSEPLRAAVELVGAERGATTACLAGATLTGPERAGALTLTGDCLEIPAGEAVAWPFTVTAQAPADGRIDGSLAVSLTAVDGQVIEVSVPLDGTMVRPVNEPLRWGLTVGLIALAVIIPLAIGWFSNSFVARFAVGPRTRVASVPVALWPDGPRRADGARALFVPNDFTYAGYGTPRRLPELELAGLRFARRLPLLPLREPTAQLTSVAPGTVVASTDLREPWGGGETARVGFGLGARLYLAVSPQPGDRGEFHGRLVSIGDDENGLAGHLEALRAHVATRGGAWSTIHRKLTEAAVADATSGSPGGGTQGGAPRRGASEGGSAEDRGATGADTPATPEPAKPTVGAQAWFGAPAGPLDGARDGARDGAPSAGASTGAPGSATDGRPGPAPSGRPSIFGDAAPGGGHPAGASFFSAGQAGHPRDPGSTFGAGSDSGPAVPGRTNDERGPLRPDRRPPSIFGS